MRIKYPPLKMSLDPVSAHAARIVERINRMAAEKSKTKRGDLVVMCRDPRTCRHCFNAAGKRIFIACPLNQR